MHLVHHRYYHPQLQHQIFPFSSSTFFTYCLINEYESFNISSVDSCPVSYSLKTICFGIFLNSFFAHIGFTTLSFNPTATNNFVCLNLSLLRRGSCSLYSFKRLFVISSPQLNNCFLFL